ncbi:DUF4783 domain-containing protein [uncultured Microscilla sp.]|uniref:DUF4783 domain-containing protein n=1 Tax=uncultured Microscilla sp. TaxID=432653 RepID=UPI0026097B95|nr:DUF4783 domain-containing protein [uncultured Microscilla sp.]
MVAGLLKNILVVFLSVLLLEGCIAKAENEITDRVKVALTQSNYHMLSRQFTERVSLSINHENFLYSKTQATFVMREFFRQYPPVNFQYLHQGIMKSGRHYTLGTYKSYGKNYSLAILLVPHQKDFLIEKLIFVETF